MKKTKPVKGQVNNRSNIGKIIPKPVRAKCRGCGKSTGKIKFYIIADDMENPKAYHPACKSKLLIEVWLGMNDESYLFTPKRKKITKQ
jgi:hypothetical protein